MHNMQAFTENHITDLKKFHDSREKSERLVDKFKVASTILLFIFSIMSVGLLLVEKINFSYTQLSLIALPFIAFVALVKAGLSIEQKINLEDTRLTNNLAKILQKNSIIRLSLFDDLSQVPEVEGIYRRFSNLERMLKATEEHGSESEKEEVEKQLRNESEQLKELKKNVGPQIYIVEKVINSGCLRLTNSKGTLTVVSLYNQLHLKLQIIE